MSDKATPDLNAPLWDIDRFEARADIESLMRSLCLPLRDASQVVREVYNGG